jgi:protein-L-isoaspartate(D-aspartate) O-methyltransferase
MNLFHDEYAVERSRMVDEQIKARGILNPAVLSAMREVPRHLFVPPESIEEAYQDHPLPLEEPQATISQPYIVAYMTDALQLVGTERVLEIGTGSGYQAAVLSRLCREVYTIERYPSLCRLAEDRLKALGYNNVTVICGDGRLGLEQHAPFDAILVTAMADQVPEPLKRQLAIGGRLVMPVGNPNAQDLIRLKRTGEDKFQRETLISVVFVPLMPLPTPSESSPDSE